MSLPPAPTAPPPPGFGVALGERTHVCDGGRSLQGAGAGGVLYLRPEAQAFVAGLPRTLAPADPPRDAVLARRLLDAGVADPWWDRPPPADEGIADVTVVVPVHDRPAAVDRLLGALPSGVPVVVVDDGSADPEALAEVCRRHGALLRRHDRNRGPAAARNTGLDAVRTPFAALCDSDVLPEPGWLGVLRRHLDDPAVAVAAPRVLGREEAPEDGWVDRYEQARSSLDLGPHPARVRVRGAVAYVPSACLLVRVGALGDGFDESLRSGEDVDLVWRLVGAGWAVRYEPAGRVRHDHRTRPVAWLRRKAFYGGSAAELARRHGDAVAPLVLAPWNTVLTGALLAQRRWSLPVAGIAAAAATAGIARRLGPADHPVRTAAVLTLEGAVASAWQTASALTRHYWPVAVLAAARSPRARRALVVAALAEGVADRRRTGADVPLASYVAAHRLDDLAYGAGLWWGAVRARSARCLVPAFVGWPGVRRTRREQARDRGSRP